MQDWLTEVTYQRLGVTPDSTIYKLTAVNSFIDLAIKRLNRVAPITEWSREDEVLLKFSDVISSWSVIMAVQARIAAQKAGEAPAATPLADLLTAEGNFFRISADMLSTAKKREVK